MERDDRLKKLRKRNVEAMNKLAQNENKTDLFDKFPAKSLRKMLYIYKMQNATKKAEKIYKELKERSDLLDPKDKEDLEELREIVSILDELSERLKALDGEVEEGLSREQDLTRKEQEEILAGNKTKSIKIYRNKSLLNEAFDDCSFDLWLTSGHVSLLAFEIIMKLPIEEE